MFYDQTELLHMCHISCFDKHDAVISRLCYFDSNFIDNRFIAVFILGIITNISGPRTSVFFK